MMTNDADESPLIVSMTGQATAELRPEIDLDYQGIVLPNGSGFAHGSSHVRPRHAGNFRLWVRNNGTGTLDVPGIQLGGQDKLDATVITIQTPCDGYRAQEVVGWR